MRRALVLTAVLGSLSVGATTTLRGQTDLDITPVYQQTPVWCWAAVGEMVFDYFGVENINPVGNFQCGIIALLHPACNQNCLNCVVPAGSLATMNNMLTQYPSFASQTTGTSTRISTSVRRQPLALRSLKDEIDAGRPVVAGISPSGYRGGVSQHVALIVGYDDDELIVNDPFPFATAFSGDPYEAAGGEEIDAGQYSIDYDVFVSRLNWRETIYNIRCRGEDCVHSGGASSTTSSRDRDSRDVPDRPQMGRRCQTQVMRCGPFGNQPALPVGSDCWCGTPLGPVGGYVVP